MSRRTRKTLQAPAGTRLEVPRPERDSYQIHLKSGAGQIYVVLINQDRDSEEPVVMQVSCNSMNMNDFVICRDCWWNFFHKSSNM